MQSTSGVAVPSSLWLQPHHFKLPQGHSCSHRGPKTNEITYTYSEINSGAKSKKQQMQVQKNAGPQQAAKTIGTPPPPSPTLGKISNWGKSCTSSGQDGRWSVLLNGAIPKWSNGAIRALAVQAIVCLNSFDATDSKCSEHRE